VQRRSVGEPGRKFNYVSAFGRTGTNRTGTNRTGAGIASAG
jgi:hypothetical protein